LNTARSHSQSSSNHSSLRFVAVQLWVILKKHSPKRCVRACSLFQRPTQGCQHVRISLGITLHWLQWTLSRTY